VRDLQQRLAYPSSSSRTTSPWSATSAIAWP
jgi:hypothetical protein